MDSKLTDNLRPLIARIDSLEARLGDAESEIERCQKALTKLANYAATNEIKEQRTR